MQLPHTGKLGLGALGAGEMKKGRIDVRFNSKQSMHGDLYIACLR